MRKEIVEYLDQRKAEGLAETSLRSYTQRLESLLRFLRLKGRKRWAQVKRDDVDAWVDDLLQRGLAFHSRQAIIITVQQFFGWLHDRGRIILDPSRHVAIARTPDEKPLPEPPLSEEEMAELLASLPRRNVVDLRNIAHVELLYSAGLRLSESLALNVADADMASRVIRVRKGKGGKPRDIPMMNGLHAALVDYLCLRRTLVKGPDCGALLLSQYGQRLSLQSFEKFTQKLNRRRPGQRHLHPHLFRHSIAVHLLRGGADIRYVQAFLGHEMLDTTKTYLRLVPADIRDAYLKAMPEIDLNASA